MYCQHCGAENEEIAKFCEVCGTKIAHPEEETNANYIGNQSVNTNYTGNQDVNTNYTGNQSLYGNYMNSQNNEEKKEKNPIIYAAAIPVIILVAALAFFMTRKKPAETVATAPANAVVEYQAEEEVPEDVEEAYAENGEEYEEEEYAEEEAEYEEEEYADQGYPLEEETVTFENIDNEYPDLWAHTQRIDFCQVLSDDGEFSFAYPRYLFNEVSWGENSYHFRHYDYDNLYLDVYEEEMSGDPRSIVEQKALETYYEVGADGDIHISDQMDSQGFYRARFGGMCEDGSGIYFIAVNDGNKSYVLKYVYPDYYDGEDLNEVNYIVDCIYQYCSFSGSSHGPRSYEDYLNETW